MTYQLGAQCFINTFFSFMNPFKVKLLKEGKEIPPELEEQMREGKMKEAQGKEEVEGLNAELQTLRDKVMGIHS